MGKHVTTYRYDNARTGWNKQEKRLTPSKVGSPKFGFLFQQSVDDMVDAQPLYVERLHVKNAKRNVVFVGTEAGTIYASMAWLVLSLIPLPLMDPDPESGAAPRIMAARLENIVYYCGDKGSLQAITIKKGKLTPYFVAPGIPNQTSMTVPKEGFPNEDGAIPVVTSHGSRRHTRVVWVMTLPDSTGLHLRAYDAVDLTKAHLFDAVIGTWSGSEVS